MDKRIKLQQGDITKVQVDAIVNAANSSLMGGGGVDGAIHRAGGKEILEACIKIVDRQGSCKTGQAVITTGGNLPSKHVIHTVGPVWNGGKNNEPLLLANCYTNSLTIAVANNVETIAFPNISTGVYRFPKEQAAEIAVKTVDDFLHTNQYVKQVVFICFDDENYTIYKKLLNLQLPKPVKMKRLFLLFIIPILLFSSCAGSKKIAGVSQITQDGISYKTAIVIQEKSEKTGTDAEYTWIRAKYPNSVTRGQSLTYYEKKPFDIIKITTADGKNMDVYFDISNFFGKL